MCVMYKSDWDTPGFREAPDICFSCGGDINRIEPNVGWAGWGGFISLHGTCAEKFGVHLVKDSREATLAQRAPVHWVRRARRAALSAGGFSTSSAAQQ